MIPNLDLQEIRQQLELELARLQGQIEVKATKRGHPAGTNLDRDDLSRP